MTILRLHRLGAAAVVLGLCLAHVAHADGTRAAIEAANVHFAAAAAKGDGAAIAALYAPNGRVLPAGSEPIRGKARWIPASPA